MLHERVIARAPIEPRASSLAGSASMVAMGHVVANAELSARRSAKVRLLVDTGPTFTVIPSSLARRLRATPLPRRFRVELADGSVGSLRACSIGVRIARRFGPTIALVVGEKAEPLLGAETLETLGLKVDPSTGKLEPSRAKATLLAGVRTRR